MTDPISGQLAGQAVQQLSQTTSPDAVDGPGLSGGNKLSFKDVMAEKTQVPPEVEPAQALEQLAPEQVERVYQAQLDDFIDGILANESDLKRMMEHCMQGGAMSQQEMLQMQALIYAYSQKVDLTTKVVEKATGGLKQVMNTQV